MTVPGQHILLVGGKGMLAGKIVTALPHGYRLTALDLPDFDVTDQAMVCSVTETERPDIIINCAAMTNVDGCETARELAYRVNGAAVGYLAEAAGKVGATLVHISTDYVFDGEATTPYVETDPTGPQSVYGHSKLLGEQALLASGLKKYFIIRTSWLYGTGGKNFVETIVRLAKDRSELRIVADQLGTPTYTGDLVEAIFHLLEAAEASPAIAGDPYGIYHFSNMGQCSWYQFAQQIVTLATRMGEPLKVEKVLPIRTDDYPLPARRPAFSVFCKDKYLRLTGAPIPEWQESLERYFAERERG